MQLSAGYCHFGFVSVRAINRSTSGFPTRWFSAAAQCTRLKAGPRAYAPTNFEVTHDYNSPSHVAILVHRGMDILSCGKGDILSETLLYYVVIAAKMTLNDL